MAMNRHSVRRNEDAPPATGLARGLRWAVTATLATASFYAVVFRTMMAVPPLDATLYALTNAVPLTVLVVVFGLAVRTAVPALSRGGRTLLHALLAPTFAATWYGAIVMSQALLRCAQGHDFALGHFPPQALAWQSVQGLTVYAAVAAVMHALARREPAPRNPPADRLERYLRKAGDAIHCVEVRDIVSISGAMDYSDVATVSGRHLARFSLAEFERRLDPARFLRVHRSGIVNLDHFERAEPAGSGCFVVTLRNGDTMRTSREGARRLRALML